MATRRHLAAMTSDIRVMRGGLSVAIPFPYGGCRHRQDPSRLAPVPASSASALFAQAVALHRTLLQPSGEGAANKNGVNVQDLPNLLFTAQVAVAQPDAGGTCCRVHNAIGKVSSCIKVLDH